MNKGDREMQDHIRALLESQPLAVLSTQRDGQPYASLMAFAHTEDLAMIVVATGTSTRLQATGSQKIGTALKGILGCLSRIDNQPHREECDA